MKRIGVGLALIAGALGTAAPTTAQHAGAALEIHHVHGLAVDRREPDVVYVATHTGLVRLAPGAPPVHVGEHRFDLMGFTAHPTTPNVVYASGHPDLATFRRDGVGNLGLLLSEDGGRTWRSVALLGEADFHALAYSSRDGGTLYGWSVTGHKGLYRISTRTLVPERLEARGLASVIALAASPEANGPLLAATEHGLLVSHDAGATWRGIAGVPGHAVVTAVAFDAARPSVIYTYVHRAGAGLMRSRDAGATWEPAGLHTGPDSPVIALATGPHERVVAATTTADLVRSADGGRTWTRLVERGRPRADAR